MATSDNHQDMRAHNHTYDGVLALLKWGTAAAFLLGAIVVVTIAS